MCSGVRPVFLFWFIPPISPLLSTYLSNMDSETKPKKMKVASESNQIQPWMWMLIFSNCNIFEIAELRSLNKDAYNTTQTTVFWQQLLTQCISGATDDSESDSDDEESDLTETSSLDESKKWMIITLFFSYECVKTLNLFIFDFRYRNVFAARTFAKYWKRWDTHLVQYMCCVEMYQHANNEVRGELYLLVSMGSSGREDDDSMFSVAWSDTLDNHSFWKLVAFTARMRSCGEKCFREIVERFDFDQDNRYTSDGMSIYEFEYFLDPEYPDELIDFAAEGPPRLEFNLRGLPPLLNASKLTKWDLGKPKSEFANLSWERDMSSSEITRLDISNQNPFHA